VFGADPGLSPALKRSQKPTRRQIGIVGSLAKSSSAVFCFSSPRGKFVLLTPGGLIRVGQRIGSSRRQSREIANEVRKAVGLEVKTELQL
jgi:hypothetical protein